CGRMRYFSLCILSALLFACNGDPADSDEPSDGGGGSGSINLASGGRATGGSSTGGAGGSPNSSSGGDTAGESGGSGTDGSGGSEGDSYPEPVCDPVPPACPEKILDGDLRVRNLEDFQEIEGVTSITGELDIGSVEMLSALDCLEEIGDELIIDV